VSVKSPLSTYRLQVNADFPFSAVRGLLEYFRDLGIGTLYFSPVFKARPRSPHGYDVTDPSKFSRDAGDEPEFAELSRAAAESGLTILLDIVPNHMAAAEDNPWWHDLLEHGSASPTAAFFDVDWSAPGCNQQIVLPILGAPLDECLHKQEIRLVLQNDELRLAYYKRSLPIDASSLLGIFEIARSHATGRVGEAILELIHAAREIPRRRECAPEQRAQRKRDAQALKASLREKLASVGGVKAALTAAVDAVNNSAELKRLIGEQPYCLEFWRSGTRRINYRRFFDIADLAGLRVEDRDVFEVTHTLTLELILAGQIEGVRIDHIDGLRDPYAYLLRLREALGDTYVVVEKILAPGEELRADWPIQGTTGYDFVGITNGLFAHPDGLATISEDYARRTQLPAFADIVYEKKKLVIHSLFAGELNGLTGALARLAARLDSPFDDDTITAALVEVSASLSIYRTYIRDRVDADDRNAIKQALTTARHRAPHLPDSLYALLRSVLLLEDLPAELIAETLEFIIAWQQFTGPVMAKGLEDTAFYTDNRLISLNEVGSYPDALATSAAQFHETVSRRATRWPFTMNASSTHDTKRSEDVRARIHTLSEMAPEWIAALDRWSALNARHKRTVDGMRVPHMNEEILLYQTLLGAWPLDEADRSGFSSRIQKFLLKASREAKLHSSWIEPNEPYEQAFFAFADAVIRDERFLDDFLPFQQEVAYYGALNSLAQLIIKLGAPGIPDIYQGNELWNFSLVDPDNRRPIDFAQRRRLLQEMVTDASAASAFARELMSSWPDGRIKLYVTWTGLQLRRQSPGLFMGGEYLPLNATGALADNVIAFARQFEDRWAIFATTRFFRFLASPGQLPVGNMWNDTFLELPPGCPGSWQNILTNEPAEGNSLESFFGTLPFGIYVTR
jgi:(1->4)-alpha-D-glucan 1-alpha-D-glucosylmutase